jgi:hypothetical protein
VELANKRAIPSAQQQGVPVVHVHADTLHDARNLALARVDTEWVIHLDADDELEPGYVDHMATGRADVRAPAVRYVRAQGRGRPALPKVAGHRHVCDQDCLTQGNWLVIGSCARTKVLQSNGWRDFPWSEDWDMWLRLYLAGYTFEAIPQAVYRAHVNPRSRNRAASAAAKLAAHRAIEKANGLRAGGEPL